MSPNRFHVFNERSRASPFPLCVYVTLTPRAAQARCAVCGLSSGEMSLTSSATLRSSWPESRTRSRRPIRRRKRWRVHFRGARPHLFQPFQKQDETPTSVCIRPLTHLVQCTVCSPCDFSRCCCTEHVVKSPSLSFCACSFSHGTAWYCLTACFPLRTLLIGCLVLNSRQREC